MSVYGKLLVSGTRFKFKENQTCLLKGCVVGKKSGMCRRCGSYYAV